MCYEQGKLRILKAKSNNNPLITTKKMQPEIKDKQNEKYNPDYHTKPRGCYPNEFTSTVQYQGNKMQNNYVNLTYGHNFGGKERYTGHQNQTHFVQTTKTLTFANVKNNGNKQKESSLIPQDQPSFVNVTQDQRKGHGGKSNVLMEKEKYANLTERIEKPLIEKQMQKKEGLVKIGFGNKNVITNHTSQIDDLACTEQLEFKPVEKKSLVPEKKYNAEKTTSKFDFTKLKKVEKRNDLKELKQFQGMEKIINMNSEAEALNFLCGLQEEYSVAPGYIDNNHKTLTWWNRAVLVEWMSHVSYEFSLKRDTYHTAVVLVDNYLARVNNVTKSGLQAIGATTLFIASKLQEFQCKESKDFVSSTNNSCSVQGIHELQVKIVKVLKFRLNPPTLFSLANKLMSQWDIFVSMHQIAKIHPLFDTHKKTFFKQMDENSYRMFREMMQLVDSSIMDIQTAQYKPKMLICSFLYLLIGRQLGIFQSKQIVEEFPGSSLYLLDEMNEFNDLFRTFLEQVFGFSLFQILPTVQYCATYFHLVFTLEKPIISEETNLQQMYLEEYCSYQTYNSSMIRSVKSRYRGIY